MSTVSLGSPLLPADYEKRLLQEDCVRTVAHWHRQVWTGTFWAKSRVLSNMVATFRKGLWRTCNRVQNEIVSTVDRQNSLEQCTG